MLQGDSLHKSSRSPMHCKAASTNVHNSTAKQQWHKHMRALLSATVAHTASCEQQMCTLCSVSVAHSSPQHERIHTNQKAAAQWASQALQALHALQQVIVHASRRSWRCPSVHRLTTIATHIWHCICTRRTLFVCARHLVKHPCVRELGCRRHVCRRCCCSWRVGQRPSALALLPCG